MTFEQYIGHIAFKVVWEVIEPQLPGVLIVAGYAIGAYYIWGLIGKYLSMVGHSVIQEGQKKK